jgi:hypothetical protein
MEAVVGVMVNWALVLDWELGAALAIIVTLAVVFLAYTGRLMRFLAWLYLVAPVVVTGFLPKFINENEGRFSDAVERVANARADHYNHPRGLRLVWVRVQHRVHFWRHRDLHRDSCTCHGSGNWNHAH